MIKRVSRKELDVAKYNACIENSLQSTVFGFSWYLDAVCNNWDVFVLNDYEAVMPVPWRKKLRVKYVYQSLWLLQLGVFSLAVEDENEFLIELFDDFKFVELRANSKNHFSMFVTNKQEKTMQILSLQSSYGSIFKGYKKRRKKDLQRAEKNDLTEKWNDTPENLINFLKENKGKRSRKIKAKDYDTLLELIIICIEKRKGEVLSIYDKNNQIVASGFFLKHTKRVSVLVSSVDFKKRANIASTFLIDRAIYKYQANFEVFNFSDSSIRNIRKYFLSFNSVDEKYPFIKQNKLPKYIRFFKR